MIVDKPASPERFTPAVPRPLDRLGSLGLMAASEPLTYERIPLPLGYTYESPIMINNKEFIALCRQVEIGEGLADDWRNERYLLMRSCDAKPVDIGVRAADGSLVGFGAIAHKGDIGELCDFVVSPEHQGRGIGKAIILERLRIAEELGITSLYVPFLETTNTLVSFYLEHGFIRTERGAYVFGPNPASVFPTDSPDQ